MIIIVLYSAANKNVASGGVATENNGIESKFISRISTTQQNVTGPLPNQATDEIIDLETSLAYR